MARKRFHLSLYVSAGIISFIIFISGVFVGVLVNEIKARSIEEGSKDVSGMLKDFETQLLLLDLFPSNSTCQLYEVQLRRLSGELGILEEELKEYENSRRIDFPEFLKMKEEYNLLLIKYWIFSENMRTKCNSTYLTLLYFYNKECSICNDEGIILTYYKMKLREKLLVFAIDMDLNLTSTKALMESFGVEKAPTLVINSQKFDGFYDKEGLRELLCSFGYLEEIC
ncbi:MAG: hypothetical protein QW507_01185 [Candidatus Nanoarchaeia archaeon]|nr:hypothetical protein [Candidatus Haiyanarchaeum thermophilum]MCW1303429.1 hypothetical protein [Candidatus Haiyanarchaeum thermophilum]MCW1303885.1 hypothetical protein [Candidatus Haiyanarchaeum thermophilum]MCW1306870.1 hypothetical protein [Candidatus Haiyanarchaeum thermophilum]MCW1307589.1 hypothetical protein [Candidatus Haiyanarchaeum thermophilum]